MFSLPHWMRLAVTGNPSVLILMFVPDSQLVVRTHVGDRLRAAAPLILSRQAGHRYLGYLRRQRERMIGGGKRHGVPSRPELVERYGYDTKFAGHALRLGLQGIELVTTGRLTLPMPEPQREQVMRVRRGRVGYDAALAEIDRVAADLADLVAGARSPLPERPDRAAVDDLLVDLHRMWWAG